jgi:hypothetical protein
MTCQWAGAGHREWTAPHLRLRPFRQTTFHAWNHSAGSTGTEWSPPLLDDHGMEKYSPSVALAPHQVLVSLVFRISLPPVDVTRSPRTPGTCHVIRS